MEIGVDLSGGFNFTAIDFETANRSRASVCAVGAVKVRGGAIIDEFSTLVSPPPGFDAFEPGNVRVHGLTERDVIDAPAWPEVYEELIGFIAGDVLVGHNARFDVSVLLNASAVYDLDWPQLSTVCTLQLARSSLSIPSYSLPWVANHLGLDAFDHHDPLSDARTSARVLTTIAQLSKCESLDSLLDRLSVPIVPTFMDEAEAVVSALESSPDAIVAVGFSDESVCFTGALKMMIRDEARRLVVEHGGLAQSGVNRKTTILVTGDFDSRTFRPGAAFSSKLQKAFDLVDSGQPLEIVTEDDFIARLSLSEEDLRTRIAQAGTSRGKLPDWVLTQARPGPSGDYWEWFNTALRYPSGRATGGEPCIWCSSPVLKSAHWIHRDRHVCGIHCNERLKRSAHRAWAREGIL